MEQLSLTKYVGVPDLPEDVFLLILENLEAWDICRCRKVARSWKIAFEQDKYLDIVLKRYPLAREVQDYHGHRTAASTTLKLGSSTVRSLFDTIASRYYHLTHGKAKSIERYKLAASEQFNHWYPVSQWDYHESQPGGRLYYENATHISRIGGKPFLFRPTLWSYDDGMIVLSPGNNPESSGKGKQSVRETSSTLILLSLQNGLVYPIPFNTNSKVIRNLRLKEKTLVIEWAEKAPFHALNESEKVHRHFATCFDVCSGSEQADPTQQDDWIVKFRCEWKVHFLGLPLNHRDRFFSTHNSQHYVVYFWQPNRSMYTGDEELPIESLFVWDISSPSPYLPSTDPTGKHQADQAGPHIVCRLVLGELDFLGIRQHSDISLMGLHIDSTAGTITIRENICVAGQGYFDPAQRLSCATTTTFLFSAEGPHLYREWDGNLPPYRGHCSMESADVEEPEKWFLPVMDVFDSAADVRFSLVQTCFTGQFVENTRVLRVKALGCTVVMEEALVHQVASMGKIAGDERWLVGQNEALEIVTLKF